MVEQSIPQPHPSRDSQWPWRLWGQWIGANALAELIGLGTSAVLWILFFMGMEDALGTLWAALLVVVGSTFLEGSAVGLAQWRVLRHPLPALTLRAWWLATALGAGIAWTLGMIPSTMMAMSAESASNAPAPEISDALLYLLAAAMGLALGPVLALPQWWVLRRHVAHAWQWIPANAAAWALGMPIIFIMMSFIPADGPTPGSVVLILVGLALAGAIVGAVHGIVLMRLLSNPRPTPVG